MVDATASDNRNYRESPEPMDHRRKPSRNTSRHSSDDYIQSDGYDQHMAMQMSPYTPGNGFQPSLLRHANTFNGYAQQWAPQPLQRRAQTMPVYNTAHALAAQGINPLRGLAAGFQQSGVPIAFDPNLYMMSNPAYFHDAYGRPHGEAVMPGYDPGALPYGQPFSVNKKAMEANKSTMGADQLGRALKAKDESVEHWGFDLDYDDPDTVRKKLGLGHRISGMCRPGTFSLPTTLIWI